jgi:hypothetical protein
VRLYCLVDPFENRSADTAKRALVAKKAGRPVRSHGKGLDFEGEILRDYVLSNFTGILSVANRLLQRPKPSLDRVRNQVAHFAGPVVEFKGRGSEKAAAGENFFFRVAKPVSTESSQARESLCLKSGANHCLHENTASLLHHSALKIFLRTKVSEKAALTYFQRGGEFADGEPFETFERSEIHGSLQNRAMRFYAARTPALDRSQNDGRRGDCKWLPRAALAMSAWASCHGYIIARPFVLLQGS